MKIKINHDEEIKPSLALDLVGRVIESSDFPHYEIVGSSHSWVLTKQDNNSEEPKFRVYCERRKTFWSFYVGIK